MGAYGPEFQNADDIDKGIKRIIDRLFIDISDFSTSLISFSSFLMGKVFVIIIDVDESSQLHYIIKEGKRIYYYRQANKNVGQVWQEAERRRNYEKYGIKM